MSWFCDHPSKDYHYSIHQIVHKNKLITKYHHNNSNQKDFDIDSDDENDWNNVEEWFAPTKISNVLKHLVKSHNIGDIAMYVPTDGVVYRDYVKKICLYYPDGGNVEAYPSNIQYGDLYSMRVPSMQSQQQPAFSMISPSPSSAYVPSRSNCSSIEESFILNNSNLTHNHNKKSSHSNNIGNIPFRDPLSMDVDADPPQWKSLIILVPIKLGVDKLNEVYFHEIKMMLEIPQSIGLIGGKPKQSFYFVGYQDDHIFYLDPHFVHDNVGPNELNFSDTYHYCVPQKMPISQLDPSMAIGFYCRTKKDFDEFCTRIKEIEKNGFPIISIGDQSPDYQFEAEDIDLDEFEEDITTSSYVTAASNTSSSFVSDIVNPSPPITSDESDTDDLDDFHCI
eukprot:gene7616-8910_t